MGWGLSGRVEPHPNHQGCPQIGSAYQIGDQLINSLFVLTGDDDLGEGGDNGEADDADLDDDWGLDNE